MHCKKVLRPVVCCCCPVWPSFIRALAFPEWALSQNTSSTVHTFSSTENLLKVQQHFPSNSSPYCPSTLSLGMNFSEELNIQKRDWPLPGPSFTNSWPSPLPHFPHRTLYAPGLSSCLDTLSSWMVSVKAGQGDECSYLERLVNSW